MTDRLSLSLWAVNMAEAPSSREDWLDRVRQALAESKKAGSSLLILPEYVSEIWLPYCAPGIAVTEEIAAMAEEGEAMIPGLQALADESGLALMAGSWSARAGEGFLNRAYFFAPGAGEPITHDKLVLTPSEKDPQGWSVGTGRQVRVFRWNGLTCAMLICLDVELPSVSCLLAKEAPDLDLLIVPSMTARLSGYSRVFGCAKARAIELLTCVAAVGCIGSVPMEPARPNVSGAAVFLPCEKELGYDGRFADSGAFERSEGAGPLLHARDIPIAEVRRLRYEGAEVWPGAWNSEGMKVIQG